MTRTCPGLNKIFSHIAVLCIESVYVRASFFVICMAKLKGGRDFDPAATVDRAFQVCIYWLSVSMLLCYLLAKQPDGHFVQ